MKFSHRSSNLNVLRASPTTLFNTMNSQCYSSSMILYQVPALSNITKIVGSLTLIYWETPECHCSKLPRDMTLCNKGQSESNHKQFLARVWCCPSHGAKCLRALDWLNPSHSAGVHAPREEKYAWRPIVVRHIQYPASDVLTKVRYGELQP